MVVKSEINPQPGQPDPSGATLARIESEQQAIKELFNARIEGVEVVVDEKFKNIEATLINVEQRRVEQKADTKISVDAALSAQKESMTKTETGILEQLKQIQLGNVTSFSSIDTKITDIKERVTKVESEKISPATHEALAKQVATLEQTVAGMAGRQAANIVAVGVFFSIVAAVMRFV